MKDKLQLFINRLEEYFPQAKEGYIDITLPVVLRISGGLLELRITPTEEGYSVCCPLDIFEDANDGAEFYFKVFTHYGKSCHYQIGIKDNLFYKEYSHEASLVCALDEFVRFFLSLDDFILNNDVIGHEENFPIK